MPLLRSKTSQSAILKALTDHCSRLSERGVFIIKNDNFVGWQVFGNNVDVAGTTAKDIHFRFCRYFWLKLSTNFKPSFQLGFS